jgi:hypothetical protein
LAKEPYITLHNMPFSQTIREEALVASGRHCCICRRFVGTKIECHHIIPETKGGDDTLANCIPLCFECHADVEHYNPSHPKGTKFTPRELRTHRDRWFQQISETTPAIFDHERRSVDREIFAIFREQVPESLARYLLKNQCWGQPIRAEMIDKIYEIDRFLERIDCEFLDPTCEGYRSTFVLSYRRFLRNNDFIQISPTDHDPNLYRLPKEWLKSSCPEEQKQFHDCMSNLNELSSRAFEAYETMIRELRCLLITQ